MSYDDKTSCNGGEVQTFDFISEPDMATTTSSSTFRSKIWQVVPVLCGSLFCVPFGIMLGWPSPTYPTLLQDQSPVPITIDQSAMIAGFLMIGNILGTPFSYWSVFGTKYALILGLITMTIGWTLLWESNSIFWLLGSRILIGLGHGYGMGQLKIFIKEFCEATIGNVLGKLLNLYVIFGVIVAYILGTFVSYRNFSLACIFVTIFILIVCVFLPHSPLEYLRFGQAAKAKKLVRFLKPHLNADEQLTFLVSSLEKNDYEMSFTQVLRDGNLRKYFIIIALLTFFQQFTGLPATIVYSEMIFRKTGTPGPQYCAIFYACVFLFASVIGSFVSCRFNKKYCLLFSSISVATALAVQIITLYFNYNKYWEFLSLFVITIYVVTHTIGLGTIPALLISEYMPPKARKVVTQFQIVDFSAMAIIITKIFQVLYATYEFYVPFCLFLGVAIICCLFIAIFVPKNISVLHNTKLVLNGREMRTIVDTKYTGNPKIIG